MRRTPSTAFAHPSGSGQDHPGSGRHLDARQGGAPSGDPPGDRAPAAGEQGATEPTPAAGAPGAAGPCTRKGKRAFSISLPSTALGLCVLCKMESLTRLRLFFWQMKVLEKDVQELHMKAIWKSGNWATVSYVPVCLLSGYGEVSNI